MEPIGPTNGFARKRIEELDSLRGFAALGVLIFHYSAYYQVKFSRDPVPAFNFSWGARSELIVRLAVRVR